MSKSNPNQISIEVPTKTARPSQKRKGAPTGPPQLLTTNDDGTIASGSGGDPAAKKQKKFFRHRLPDEEKPEKEDKEVGVSKLKASLRQATRFLAKQGLAADVRTETERKVKSLQADLDRALIRNEEKKNAAKYHMVKFFERQKLLRRLKPLLKLSTSTDPTPDSATLASTNKDIHDLRIGLNYVLHYPNSQKYISLFPPPASGGEGDVPETEAAAVAAAETDKVGMPIIRKPKKGKKVEGGKREVVNETEVKRSELVERIKVLMEEGKLSSEPEKEVLHDASKEGAAGSKRKRSILESSSGAAGDASGEGGAEKVGLAGDDFFGGDESD